MKLAADFRKIAREALRGRWKIAVLVGLVHKTNKQFASEYELKKAV